MLKEAAENGWETNGKHGLSIHRQAMAKILHAVRYTKQGTSVYVVSEYL